MTLPNGVFKMIRTNKMFEISRLYRYFYELVGYDFTVLIDSDNKDDSIVVWLEITINGDSIIQEIQTELPYKFKFHETYVLVEL
jgi:hypothetical protein